MEEKRIIRVTGKGVIKVKPDTTRITITLQGRYHNYDETLKRSSEDTEYLKEILSRYGFVSSDVKTLSFDVETKYESYHDHNRDWKQRFAGYEYTHRTKVEFSSDNNRLGKILYGLATAKKIKPEFRLSYTVSDPEAAKNLLLGNAVADAKAKAAVLSRATGVTLKDILSIDYSWGEINLEHHLMEDDIDYNDDACSGAEEGFDMDIEPNDIEVKDIVTVVWEIATAS